MELARVLSVATGIIGWCLCGLVSSPVVGADGLRLAALFTDHCVLQQQRPIQIWGWSDPGETIRVRLEGQEGVTLTDDRGNWRVTFAPRQASFNPLTLQVVSESTGQRLEVRDLLVGEVWHASGQSNMEMSVAAMLDRLPVLRETLDQADQTAIRFCRLDATGSSIPLTDLSHPANWKAASPETVRSFSGVAYYFARRLHETLNVPIGILDSSRGGTPIEPFIPREAFRGHPTLERELELGDANNLAGIAQLAGGVWARDENWLPGRLFHSRIAPIRSFATRGVIWYQGESNCGDGEDPRYYQHKMRALVRGWRAALQDNELPFYYVQLPGSGAREGWPYLREQQRLAMDLPHTGMVVTVDLLDGDIHPPNKVDVGHRLSRWALRSNYHQSVAASGPLFRDVRLVNGQAIVAFDHVESGLMVARKIGLESPQELPGTHDVLLFELADRQGRWWPARATIKDETVVVSSEQLDEPIAVRYAYEVSPQDARLYNRDGLPASPFCSSPSLLRGEPSSVGR